MKEMGRAAPKKGHQQAEGVGEKLTYGRYLKLSELLSLQKPLSSPVEHDEVLFIIIHQTYELWFKQVIFELESAIQLMLSHRLEIVLRRFHRISEIFRTLIQQIDILETMSPMDFNRFRDKIDPASGFQSAQFRQLELLAGAKQSDYVKYFEYEPEWKKQIQIRLENPNLHEAFLSLLSKNRLLTKKNDLTTALGHVYRDPKFAMIKQLCESLLQFDEQFTLWRFRHVQMVERIIGMKPGTGGSLGVRYLQTTLDKRFFPEIWEVRTSL